MSDALENEKNTVGNDVPVTVEVEEEIDEVADKVTEDVTDSKEFDTIGEVQDKVDEHLLLRQSLEAAKAENAKLKESVEENKRLKDTLYEAEKEIDEMKWKIWTHAFTLEKMKKKYSKLKGKAKLLDAARPKYEKMKFNPANFVTSSISIPEIRIDSKVLGKTQKRDWSDDEITDAELNPKCWPCMSSSGKSGRPAKKFKVGGPSKDFDAVGISSNKSPILMKSKMRANIPELPNLFPVLGEVDEDQRLGEVERLKLFDVDLPLTRIEAEIEAHMDSIKDSFDVDALLLGALGVKEFRLLVIMVQDKGHVLRTVDVVKSRWTNRYHRCLSVCQLVAGEKRTLTFSGKNPIPVAKTMQRFPSVLEDLSQFDPTMKSYMDDAKERGIWETVMDILLGNAEVSEETKNLNFNNFWNRVVCKGQNYIGSPLLSNGFVVGTLCFLHNEKDDEGSWLERSGIEKIAKTVEKLLPLIQPSLQQIGKE